MNIVKLCPKFIFTFLGIYLGCLAMPHQALALTIYTINSTSGSNGSVAISNTISSGGNTYYVVNGQNYRYTPANFNAIVDAGSSVTYTIKPNVGYVANVSVNNGPNLGNISSYAFTNVNANQTIKVTFTLETFTIKAAVSPSNEATITPPATATVNYGATPPTYSIKSLPNYVIASVTVSANGKLYNFPTSSPYTSFTYNFPKVTANGSITANIVPSKYTVAVIQPNNGTITPSATTTVAYNSRPSFNIKLDSGYTVAHIYLNGNLQTSTAQNFQLPPVTQNETLSALLVPSNYVITGTAGNNGTISPAGSTLVAYNGQETFAIKSAPGYEISTISVDGSPVAVTNPLQQNYTFKNVATMYQTINVTFAQINYQIVASSSGAGAGTIIPSNTTSYAYNATPTLYKITANANSLIASVTVNGKLVENAPLTSFNYQFPAISATTMPTQTIAVYFVPSTYTVTVNQPSNGSITPVGPTSVKYEANSPAYTVSPAIGYSITSITLNGTALKGINPAGYSFYIKDVTSNQTIGATTTINTYKITASAGSGGSISSPGISTFNYGATPSYTVTANTGYFIESVKITINGATQTISSPTSPYPYKFPGVASNGSISATFALITYKITATVSGPGHGSISPPGTINVGYNGSQTYTIKPDSGNLIASVSVDGVLQNPIPTSYQFTKDEKPLQTINVVFAAVSDKMTAIQTPNGSISPAKTTTIAYNGSLIYSATPDYGFVVSSYIVDGKTYATPPASYYSLSYPFFFISTDHSFSANFVPSTYTITATTTGTYGTDGGISPAGITSVNYGANQSYTVTPGIGYLIKAVSVDGVDENITNQASFSYTFPFVHADHIIQATFIGDTAISDIANFYNNALGNAYIINPSLFNTAVTQVNSLKQNGSNAYNTALDLLVNDLYSLANNAISQYQDAPNARDLQIAINDVSLLQPYNSFEISGVGYYDYFVTQLAQSVTTYLASINNLTTWYAQSSNLNADNSFGAGVAIDASSNVYVSAPSSETNGLGLIYEIEKTSSKVLTITPVSPLEGDHFGRSIAVSGSNLVASSEPADGLAQVYVFTLKNGGWVQQTILDLTAISNISAIHHISLALSNTSIVVGLPEYGKYLVFDKNTAANVSANDIWQLDLNGSLNSNNTAVSMSLAANGNYIAIGAPGTSNSFVRILNQTKGDATHIYNWSAVNYNSNNSGFGTSVGIAQSTTSALAYTLAIGSPNENNGAGAAYTLTGTVNGTTGSTVLSTPQAVSLFVPSTTTLAGSEIALNSGMLVIGDSAGKVNVYKLNSSNQWVWAYGSNQASYFANAVASNGAIAVIGSENTQVANCSDYTGSGPCPQSNVQVVQP